MNEIDRRKQYREYYAANKERRRADARRYAAEHKEQRKESWKSYYAANKERLNAQHRAWIAKHKEHIKEYDKKRRDVNRDPDREASRLWRLANPERVKEYNKQWGLLNPDKWKRLNHNYRARKNGNGGSYTIDELNRLFVEQEYLCYYCGKPFFNNTLNAEYHVEHKTPLSRGGSNDILNIVIACPRCNLTKSAKTAEEFLATF